MNKNLVKALLVTAVIVVVYSFLIIPFRFFNKVRFFSSDLISRCVYKISPKVKTAENIVVVSIDRDSLRNMGEKWPWPRNVFAEFLIKLGKCKPRVTYLDFSFIGETPEDDSLAKAMSENGNVVIPSYFDEHGNPLYPAQKFLESAAGFGPVNKLRDEDMVVRDAILLYFSPVLKNEIIDYSAELIILCRYFGVSIGDVSIEKGDLVINTNNDKKIIIPIKKNGVFPINYTATMGDIRIIPFWKVVKEDLPPDTFKDKIVVVGLTDRALLDVYNTPLGASSGVGIIVNTILTVLSENYVKYVSRDMDFPMVLFIMALLTMIIFRTTPLKAFLSFLLIVAVYFGIVFFLSWHGFRFEIFSVVFLGIIIYVVMEIYRFISLLEEQNYDLQKALKDLKEKEAELIESEKLAAIGKITAQLSHEINNPLCAIQNNVGAVEYIIKRGEKLEKIGEIIKQVSDEVKRLTKLSRDILNFSRPLKESMQPVDLNDILNETVNLYKGQLKEAKVEISLGLSQKLPLVLASSDKLRQVFSNLILNAQEAMPGGGEINVESSFDSSDNCAEVSITDTGTGIPDEIMGKIFQPFFTTKKGGKGTGLGLFTVYNIIKGHRGSIKVMKNKDKGTKFIIKLPVS